MSCITCVQAGWVVTLSLADVMPGYESAIRWIVESPARGVVNVVMVVGDDFPAAPLHFRVGDWSKPPVDISISEDGAILGFQVVLQDEIVAVAPGALGESHIGIGCPRLDVTQFPDDRYWDERSDVVLARAADGVLVVSLCDRQIDARWRIGEGFVVGFSTGQLVELRLGPLGRDEWKTIEASAVP